MNPQEFLDLARRGDLDALDDQSSELLAAVESLAEGGDAVLALELVARSWRVWSRRGEWDQGSRAAAAALDAPGGEVAPVWRARVLYADGLFAFRSGDGARSKSRNEETLKVAWSAGDARGESDALTGLARLALRDGRYADAVALAQEGRKRAATGDDREAEAAPLHLEAAGLHMQQSYEAARDLYLQSLALNSELGNTGWVAMEQHNLGWVSLHLEDVEAAERHFRERDAGSQADAYGDAWSDLNWAGVASIKGDTDGARQRFVAGKLALDRMGSALDPDDQAELEWLTHRLSPSVK